MTKIIMSGPAEQRRIRPLRRGDEIAGSAEVVRVLHQPHAGIGLRDPGNDAGGGVGGSVVVDHQIKIVEGLPKKGMDRLRQKRLAVSHR